MGMADAQLEDAWRRHHPYLVNLAYQMLGDIGDAEDVAQEAFFRLSGTEGIDDVRGWLTVVAGRLCLDQVRSARHRYESATGETILEERASLGHLLTRRIASRSTIRSATRCCRCFGVSVPASGWHSCCTMCSRCRSPRSPRRSGGRSEHAGSWRVAPAQKVQAASPPRKDVTRDEHREVTERFISACATGDFAQLTAVLDPTVWGAATLLGDPPPPPQINYGPEAVATNLMRYVGHGATLVCAPVGQPVLLGFAERRLFAVLVLTVRDGLVAKIEATADPSARGWIATK